MTGNEVPETGDEFPVPSVPQVRPERAGGFKYGGANQAISSAFAQRGEVTEGRRKGRGAAAGQSGWPGKSPFTKEFSMRFSFAAAMSHVRSSCLIVSRVLRRLGRPRSQPAWMGPDKVAASASRDLVDSTREIWADDPRVRIADAPAVRFDRDGLWIAAELLAGARAIDPRRLAAALGELPLLPREVYLLHHHGGLDERAIARRLAIDEMEVRAALVTALVLLDRALGAR